MLITNKIQVDDFGKVEVIDLNRIGTIKNIILSTKENNSLEVTVIINGYEEIISDLTVNNKGHNIFINKVLETNNVRVIIKSKERLNTEILTISFNIC